MFLGFCEHRSFCEHFMKIVNFCKQRDLKLVMMRRRPEITGECLNKQIDVINCSKWDNSDVEKVIVTKRKSSHVIPVFWQFIVLVVV